MDKDYVCSKCKKTGDRNAIPYRIIKETIDKCAEVINKLEGKLKNKDQEVDSLLMLKNLIGK